MATKVKQPKVIAARADALEVQREFLLAEFQANRSHADHINNHRLDFLKFFVGVVISAIGLTQFLLLQLRPTKAREAFLQPLLFATIAFGLLTVLVISNYWVARDFVRLKNRVIVEELTKVRPSLERYHAVTKSHVKKLPSFTSMFAFVLGLIVIANGILLFLLLALRHVPASLIWISFASIGQVIVVLGYRRLFYGKLQPLP